MHMPTGAADLRLRPYLLFAAGVPEGHQTISGGDRRQSQEQKRKAQGGRTAMKAFTRCRSLEPPDTWKITGVTQATGKSDNGYLVGTGK